MHCSLRSGVRKGWVRGQLHVPAGGLHEGFSWSLSPVSSQVKLAQHHVSGGVELRTETIQKKLPSSGPGIKEEVFRCQFLFSPDGQKEVISWFPQLLPPTVEKKTLPILPPSTPLILPRIGGPLMSKPEPWKGLPPPKAAWVLCRH